MQIKTIQEWIEYAEEIEESCHKGEDVYDKELVAVDDMMETIKEYLRDNRHSSDLDGMCNLYEWLDSKLTNVGDDNNV